ncbi:MAG: TlpA family protein disulfide reductase [Nitrospirae bacterium]|nr:TlpA family protein disulfide reductase [Nitrospirota bacterium]
MKSAKTTVIILSILFLTAISLYLYLENRTPFSEKKPAVNDVAPEISLADLTGKMVSLAAFDGKVVLVNFWAGWCPPCKDELPGFQRVYASYQDKGFEVIAIALDDIEPSLLQDMGITFPVVKTNPRVTKSYGDISDVPVSFLVGKDGRIIRKVRKVYDEASLRQDVERALAIKK